MFIVDNPVRSVSLSSLELILIVSPLVRHHLLLQEKEMESGQSLKVVPLRKQQR